MAGPDPNAEWWTAEEVAAYLGVGRRTVHAYKARGQMPAAEQQYGTTPLWRPTTITAWHATRNPRNRGSADST